MKKGDVRVHLPTGRRQDALTRANEEDREERHEVERGYVPNEEANV